MDEEEVVFVKVLDEERGKILFEGSVSTDVAPGELVHMGCFCERNMNAILNKATSEELGSFKGLQDHVELVAGYGENKQFSGVLYVCADDDVVRRSKVVPSCDCKMMSVWRLSLEESDKAFQFETLEVLEMNFCDLMQPSNSFGKMKKIKRLRLYACNELKNIPEDIGQLSSLEELWIEWCGIESLSKRLRDLRLKSIKLVFLSTLQLHPEDLVVLSKVKHLEIKWCDMLFSTQAFSRLFWEVVKFTTDLRSLYLDWKSQDREMAAAALGENGSIVDGGLGSEPFSQFFKRNKENHERVTACVCLILAIIRWRNALNGVPKEMVRMIAMMLWDTKCDAVAWS